MILGFYNSCALTIKMSSMPRMATRGVHYKRHDFIATSHVTRSHMRVEALYVTTSTYKLPSQLVVWAQDGILFGDTLYSVQVLDM